MITWCQLNELLWCDSVRSTSSTTCSHVQQISDRSSEVHWPSCWRRQWRHTGIRCSSVRYKRRSVANWSSPTAKIARNVQSTPFAGRESLDIVWMSTDQSCLIYPITASVRSFGSLSAHVPIRQVEIRVWEWPWNPVDFFRAETRMGFMTLWRVHAFFLTSTMLIQVCIIDVFYNNNNYYYYYYYYYENNSNNYNNNTNNTQLVTHDMSPPRWRRIAEVMTHSIWFRSADCSLLPRCSVTWSVTSDKSSNSMNGIWWSIRKLHMSSLAGVRVDDNSVRKLGLFVVITSYIRTWIWYRTRASIGR